MKARIALAVLTLAVADSPAQSLPEVLENAPKLDAPGSRTPLGTVENLDTVLEEQEKWAAPKSGKFVPIPHSPFEVRCPEGFRVDEATYSQNPENDPRNGISSATGHLHVYRRIAEDVDTAIRKTESVYRDMAARRDRPMPVLLEVRDYSTDTGLEGKMAFFGDDSSVVRERKFYFTGPDGLIYCACLEARDAATWIQLESLLQTLRPVADDAS